MKLPEKIRAVFGLRPIRHDPEVARQVASSTAQIRSSSRLIEEVQALSRELERRAQQRQGGRNARPHRGEA